MLFLVLLQKIDFHRFYQNFSKSQNLYLWMDFQNPKPQKICKLQEIFILGVYKDKTHKSIHFNDYFLGQLALDTLHKSKFAFFMAYGVRCKFMQA